MATTTNYSWSTPDDTDLVKDGAAAIRTLGSSIDTSVKALSPGTTAGDVDYYTTSTAKARLGIGTAGQVLTVNSGATAPEWTTISTGAYTLLSTTTLSGTTTTISSISGSYTDLMVIVNNPYVNVAASLRIDPNATASISFSVGAQGNAVSTSSEIISHTSNLLPIVSTVTNSFALYIRQYANATFGKPFQFHGGTTNQNSTVNRAGFIQTASAITSLAITTAAGTSTYSGGQVLVYGVK